MSLTGKVGIVTGGTSGIGRATALALAEAGARVVVAGRSVAQGEEVAKHIKAAGGQAIFHKTDVISSTEVRALVARAVQEFGRLDLAFNNAGYEGQLAPLHEQDDEKAAYLLDVNVIGLFYCLKYEVERMLQTGGGAIVNHSSINGLKGNPNGALYIASKHAVVGMTRGAALDYAEKGIRVNAVAPGPIDTPMLERMGNPQSFARFAPMRRLGKPEEVARAVLWLLSDEASYVTGHILSVDGGICAR